jgi:hypothetical protein
MKLKILIVGLLLVAASLSGCIGGKDATEGTYRCTVDDGILFLQNGEYEMDIAAVHGGNS